MKQFINFVSKDRSCLFLGLTLLLCNFAPLWIFLVLSQGAVDIVWQMELALATVLSLTIIFLAVQQIFSTAVSQERKMVCLQKELEEQKKKSSELEKLYSVERGVVDQEIEDLRNQLESCREEFFSKEGLIKQFENKQLQLHQELEKHKEYRSDAYLRLEEAQNTQEKVSEERDRIQKEVVQASQEMKKLEEEHRCLKDILEEKEKIQNMLIKEGETLHSEVLQLQRSCSTEDSPDLIQLRKQFEEKSELLNQTRQELFHSENQLLAVKKGQEEILLEENRNETSWIFHILTLEKERAALEQEISLLEEVITQSLPKKKGRSSGKKNPAIQQDLFMNA